MRDDAAIIPLHPPGLHPLGRNDWKNIPQYLDVHLSLLCLSAPGEMWDKRSVGEKVRLWAETHAADGPETRSEYWAWQSSPRGLPGRRGSGAKLHGLVFLASRLNRLLISICDWGWISAVMPLRITDRFEFVWALADCCHEFLWRKDFFVVQIEKNTSPFSLSIFGSSCQNWIFPLWSSFEVHTENSYCVTNFFVIWDSWPWMIHARSKNFSKKLDKKHVCRWLKTLCFKQCIYSAATMCASPKMLLHKSA